jgi:polyisoprenoid-binding protein YceI
MLLARLAAIVAVPASFAVAQPAANPVPHTIDKAHSQINFIADSRLISARGHFNTWDAEVLLDAANMPASSVKITIDAKSIDTRVERRDNHLRSGDFFDVENNPTITFVSTGVTPAGEGKLTIEGDLTVRGTTKRMTIPTTMVFYEGGTGRFRGEFVLDRTAFGVSYDSKLNPIDKNVTVQFDIALNDATKK